MAYEFDSLSEYTPLTEMSDLRTNIVADISGGAIATVADFAASTWNSLAPAKYETTTEDLLGRISDNALRVYEENPDVIHTASFIGGIFVPVGLSLKVAGAARNGMKGVNWFSQAGKVDQMEKIDGLIKAGKMASEEYKVATRALYMRNAANIVADNVIAEAAIVGAMSAHPFMEDYMKDPMQNFALGVALGTAFTAPFSHIGTSYEVKKLGIAAYEEATTALLGVKKKVEDTIPLSLQIAQHQVNIDNWSTIANPPAGTTSAYSALTQKLATNFVQSARVEQVQAFEKMASAEFIGMGKDFRDRFIQKMAAEPNRFAGINKISFATAKEEASLLKSRFDSLVQTTENLTGIPLTKNKIKDGQTVTVTNDMVYSPTFDAFFPKGDLKGYGVAADLIQDEKELVKGYKKNWYTRADEDAGLITLNETSSKVDLNFLQKLKLVDEMTPAELSHMKIHPEDTATINAVLAKLEKMRDAGESITDIKVILSQVKPNFEAIEKAQLAAGKAINRFDTPIAELKAGSKDILPKELASLKTYGLSPKKMKAVHKTSLGNLIANSYDEFLHTTPLSATATEAEKAVHEATASQYIKAQVDNYVKEVNEFEQLKKLNSTDESVTADFTKLQETLLKTKNADIQALAQQGTPIEVISLRTNTPIDSVKQVLTQAKQLQEVDYRSYSKADQIGQQINPDKRSIQVGTTATAIPVAQMRSKIQSTMLDETDTVLKQTFLMQSDSAILKDMAQFLFTKDNETRYGMLKAALAKITPAALGNRFFQSADFVVRDMGDAGAVLAQMGKDSTHLYNKYADRIIKPISSHFGAIVKDAAGTIEFNTAREVNASIDGYREFRINDDGIGQFFRQDKTVKYINLPDGTKVRNMVPVQWQGKDFTVSTPSVVSAFDEMHKAGRELYEMNSAYRKILGQSALSDNGFWMPAFNPRNKFITYVIDNVDGSTRLLHGNTAAELVSAENAFTAMMAKRTTGTYQLVRKGEDQKLFNIIENRHDPMFMSTADINALHSGSSTSAIVPTNANIFSELANAYEHYVHKGVAQHLELQYSDVMSHLDSLRNEAKSLVQGQPISDIQKTLNHVDDAGTAAKNILLGRNNLKEYVGWQNAQNGIQTIIEMGLQKISKVMDPIISAPKGLFGKTARERSTEEWEAITKDLADRGIPYPFQGLDEATAAERFHVEKISQAPNMTARTVALGNNLTATLMLKMMELGQPLVNMLSLPILTSAAVQKTFAAEFMGTALKPNFHLSTTEAMYDGMRYLAHPDYAKYKAKGKELGVLDPVLSETSELLQNTRSFNPGFMQRVENILSHQKGKDISHLNLGDQLLAKFVEMTSRPAMWSEKAVREVSFATGVSLAKKAYPGLSDSGVVTFARNFVDTAVGNYNAAQRPTMFQGTIGTGMGLFQTYMVTLGQQIYRKAELRDYKNLMKMTLTQASIFGVKSLPGFNQVSEQIGEHFSDNHVDLTTGTYRATTDTAADLILYGLPSNLGPAVYSRGDIQPRIPNILDLQSMASVNILGQAAQTAVGLVGITKQIGDEGVTKAFMEALSVQSISRPIARMSELVTGHAVTRKGNEVAGPEEVYSTQGVMARVFATRGIREAKAREAQYLNSLYKSIDTENRSNATKQLKNHIRSGTLTDDVIGNINEKYMRTGSPSGWNSAVNTALEDTDSPGVSAVRNRLHPSSPLNMMIDNDIN